MIWISRALDKNSNFICANNFIILQRQPREPKCQHMMILQPERYPP